jgi:cytochrome c556
MTLFKNRISITLFLIAHLVAVLMLAPEAGYGAKKKDKDKKNERAYIMTESELQSQVMGFADRFVAMMVAASSEYDDGSPSPENRRLIRSHLVFSISNAFIIAAEPDPDFALLDMVVMVTLGRMVFEEHWMKKVGNEVAPFVRQFRKTERDIWQIAGKVLTEQQQKDLMALIKDWRRNNPGVVMFSYVRFRDFASDQQKSKSSKPKKYSRLFGSVEKATQQVEEVRLLAERGMYLGTRIPMLTGAFGDVWLSQWAANPDVKEILTNLHNLSGVSQRLAEVAEKLPDNVTAERQATVKQVVQEVDRLSQVTLDRIMQKVAVEREATVNQLVDRVTEERESAIKHLMDRMASERKRTIEEFLSEEKRIHGLLTDLKDTLTAGNDMLTVTNTLVERLNLGGATTPSEPFDIKDYQATLGEASNVIRQLKDLVETVDKTGLEESLPQVIKIIEQIEEKGKKWVTRTVILGVVLIIIFLIGAVFAMLAYRYLSQRIFEMNRPSDFSKT